MSMPSTALPANGADAAKPRVTVLEYQQSSRARRWRRFAARWTGRLLVPALVLGIAGAGWWWREWIADWFGWQMAMRAAWRHEMPAEGASIVVNGEKAKRLATESDDYVLDADGVAVYHPAALRRLAEYDWRLAHMDQWMHPYPGRDNVPIAFMGVIRRPDGQERLVVVTGGACNSLRLLEDVQVLVLPAPSLASRERLDDHSPMLMQRTGQVFPAVLHIGRRDRDDPGRILLPFTRLRSYPAELGERGVIALKLDDADEVHASIVAGLASEELQLQADRLSMPPKNGLPHKVAPWRTPTVLMRSDQFLSGPDFDW